MKIIVSIVDDELFDKIIQALEFSLYTEGIGLIGIGKLAVANNL